MFGRCLVFFVRGRRFSRLAFWRPRGFQGPVSVRAIFLSVGLFRLTHWTRTNAESQSYGLSLVGDWDTYDGDELINGILTPFNETRTHNDVHEITGIAPGNAAAQAIEHDPETNLVYNRARHLGVGVPSRL